METNQLQDAERTLKRFPRDSFIKGVQHAGELRTILQDLFALQASLGTSIRKKLRRGRPKAMDASELTADQIWQMLNIWQVPLETWLEGMTENLHSFDVRLLQTQGEDEEEEEEEDDDLENDEDFNEDEDLEEDDEDEEDEEAFFDDGDAARPAPRKATSASGFVDPILDDELFRVAQMDEFADKMELQMMKDRDLEDKEDEEDEENEDDDMDSYDSQDEDEDTKKFIRNAMFAENEEEDDDEEDINVRFDDFFGAVAGKAEDANAAAAADKRPTKRQAARNELLQRIKQLEDEAMSEKPWETKGEVKASSRPKDSLLDKQDVLDVDFLKRSTPALTPEVAKEIESYILKRVLEGKFDDREPVSEEAGEEKPGNDFVLSKERSKEGLGETYAREYEEQVLHHKPKDQVELERDQAEIKGMFESLCQKLDSLSNLVYTPKPPPGSKETKGSRPPDIAAIHMEDIVPTTEAGGVVHQTAPEELERRAKGLGKSDKELTPSERKALRRRNKEAAKKRKGPTTIVPVRAKRIKMQEGKISNDRDSGKTGTDWTSSAQVFRRIEDQQRQL